MAAMAALLVLAACSASREQRFRERPIFSPNGELLSAGGRGAPPCFDLLGQWWERLALAHDDKLARDVFVADAEAQFTAMDLDHDGFITPSELSEYRANIEEPVIEDVPPPGAAAPAPGPAGGSGGGSRRGQGRNGPAAVAQRPSAGKIPADVVDPVMSADKSLSFKVSHADFMAQAAEVFADLDKNHDGWLSREEVVASCPARP